MFTVNGKEVFDSIEEILNPRHTALVVTDFQNDSIAENGALDKLKFDLSFVRRTFPSINRLAEKAREVGVKVVFTQWTLTRDFRYNSAVHINWLMKLRTSGGYVSDEEAMSNFFEEGTWGHEIYEGFHVQPTDIIVKKYRVSTFIGTCLDLVLRANGIRAVAIAGIATQGAVENTARDAFSFDYYPVIVEDCVCKELRNPEDIKIHEASLRVMRSRFHFTTSDQAISIWNKYTEREKNLGKGTTKGNITLLS